MIMGQHLAVSRMPGVAMPPRGAQVHIPDVAAAHKRRRSDDVAALSWDEAIVQHLGTRPNGSRLPIHGRSQARNVILDIASRDETS